MEEVEKPISVIERNAGAGCYNLRSGAGKSRPLHDSRGIIASANIELANRRSGFKELLLVIPACYAVAHLECLQLKPAIEILIIWLGVNIERSPVIHQIASIDLPHSARINFEIYQRIRCPP